MTTPLLKQATAELSAGRSESALTAMLTAWRAARRPRLGTLITLLSRSLESEDARSLRRQDKRTAHGFWMATAEKGHEADRAALCEALTVGTIGQVKKRLKVVATWPADPRVADEVLRWIQTPPWASTSSQPAWNAAFRCLITSTSPHAVAEVRRRAATSIDTGGSMRAWMAAALPRLLKRMEKVVADIPDDATAEAALDALQAAVSAATGVTLAAPQSPPEERLAAALSGLTPAPLPALSATPSAAAGTASVLTMAAGDGLAWACDAETPALSAVYTGDGTHRYSLTGSGIAALSADGGRLLQATGTTLRLYHAEDGALLAERTLTLPVPASSRHPWTPRAVLVGPEGSPMAAAFGSDHLLSVALLSADLSPDWLLHTRQGQWMNREYTLALSTCGRFLYGGGSPLLVYDLQWRMFRQLAEGWNVTSLLPLPGGRIGLQGTPNAPSVLDACLGFPLEEGLDDYAAARGALDNCLRPLRQAAPLVALGGVATGPVGWLGSRLFVPTDGRLTLLGLPTPEPILAVLKLGVTVLVARRPYFDRHREIEIRATASGKAVGQLAGHTEAVNAMAASATHIATGSDDNSVRLWGRDYSAGPRLDGHSGRVTAVAFSADGRLLASGGGDGLRIWSVPDGDELAHVSTDAPVIAVGFSGAAVLLVTGSSVLHHTPSATRTVAMPAAVRHAAIHPGGRVVAACVDGALWSWQPGADPAMLLSGFLRPPAVAFDSNGALHIAGGHRTHHGALLTLETA